ncbi:MAG: sodium:proton antiporter [Planctomycetota bacterium]|nr:sodium:proton antiporter [Planctomycetota bacterium]
MHGDDRVEGKFLWYGPRLWVVTALLGVLAGWGATRLLPPTFDDAGIPIIPLALVAPFALLLLTIAVAPLVDARWWHQHFPDVAFFLGALIATYYLIAFRPAAPGAPGYGSHAILHAGMEYYSFIALVGGLYVVSGGILIDLRGRAGPMFNVFLLAFGAIVSNAIGTTGASMLLIRPFMRANHGRLTPLHIVMFIFIVSNCGGSLTPIGDPPLYLGYLKGVPFFWTTAALIGDWAFTVGALLTIFFVIDTALERATERARALAHLAPLEPAAFFPKPRIRGTTGLICLGLMIAGVFIDPALHAFAPHLPQLPFGATFQILVAATAYVLTPKETLKANEFSFFPVKEVGILFLGIFLTMIPALGYLAANGSSLGIDSPTAFYFGTGALSAVLDNAPTYLNFLQVAVPGELTPDAVRTLLQSPGGRANVIAISTGAVFFGAMTYIGNGPNFMVRTIAESAGVKMPSFFGYLFRAIALLLPVLVVHWVIFIR